MGGQDSQAGRQPTKQVSLLANWLAIHAHNHIANDQPPKAIAHDALT